MLLELAKRESVKLEEAGLGYAAARLNPGSTLVGRVGPSGERPMAELG